MLSMREDFLPEQYLRWTRKTQDEAPCPITNEQAKEIVEKSLGKPISELFAKWEEEPVGVASIGQVYRAWLHDGTEVAVKVQSPDAEMHFRADLATSKMFCKIAMPQFSPALDEIERQFETEFDYNKEAKNLNLVYDNLQEEWGDKVVIPQAHLDLCTPLVLTMDFIKGRKLVEGIRRFYRQYAKRNGLNLEELEAEEKRKMSDPNYKFRTVEEESARQYYLYWTTLMGDVCSHFPTLCWNYSLGFIFGQQDIKWSILPIDLGSLFRTVFEIHGHEMLIDGCFNGDPHPGNILLTDDGKVALIDYGQVKKWSDETRIGFAKMILAIAADDKQEITDVQYELGLRTKYMNPDVIYRLTCFYFDRDTPEITGGLNIHQLMTELESQDPMQQMIEEFVMAGRCCMMVRSIALAFGMRLRGTDFLAPYARRCLKEAGVEYKYL